MTDVIERTTAAISATADISKLDSRCRGWAIVVHANQPLPMPGDVLGANSLPQPYEKQASEGVELFPGDYALWGEEEHHRKNRGWVYRLFAYDKSGTAERLGFRSEVKEQIKAALHAPPIRRSCAAPATSPPWPGASMPTGAGSSIRDRGDPMTSEQLKAAGELLVGPEWQRAFARMLGPYHPDGHRDAIDDRLVRRWAAGDRAIPPWVDVVIEMQLEYRAQEFEAAAKDARQLSDILVDQLQFKHDDDYVRHVQTIMAKEAR